MLFRSMSVVRTNFEGSYILQTSFTPLMIHWYKKLLTRCGRYGGCCAWHQHRPAQPPKYPVHINKKYSKNLNKFRLEVPRPGRLNVLYSSDWSCVPARPGPGGPQSAPVCHIGAVRPQYPSQLY